MDGGETMNPGEAARGGAQGAKQETLRGAPARRFMDVVKEDTELIGARGEGEMVAGDWLRPPLKEEARRSRVQA